MTAFAEGLNEDTNGIRTSSGFGNRGDGVDDWFEYMRTADGGHATIGAKADAAIQGGATTGSVIALLKGLQKALGINTDAVTPTGDGYVIALLKALRDTLRLKRPSDSTHMNASSGNVANLAAIAAMAASSGVANYCTGFEITYAGATAASNVVATLAGLNGGTISFICVVPAGATVKGDPLLVRFDPPLPASATNTAITLTLGALGAGNTHACVNIHGYRV